MAEAEYWRFTVARDCQKKNTSENHSECRLRPLADGFGMAVKNVITISEYILCGEQCRYEIFDRESDENNLDLEFFICQSAATKNYRSKISIYIDHWDYLI
jgi:hypothetical protein